jgi:hypothetical protein
MKVDIALVERAHGSNGSHLFGLGNLYQSRKFSQIYD